MATALVAQTDTAIALTALVDRARETLAGARTAAEVIEARDTAALAGDVAKKSAHFLKRRQAHEELISRALRLHADALDIEAAAKRRLADEYDSGQARGEVAKIGDNLPRISKQNSKPTISDIGLTGKEIHEARIIRDAEKIDPGIVRRTLDAALAAGEEPTRAKVRRAVLETARPQQAAPKPPPGRGKDAIRERVLEAIVILSGLPPAHEVAAYFAGTDTAIIVSERLRPAASWLADFNDAWKDEQC